MKTKIKKLISQYKTEIKELQKEPSECTREKNPTCYGAMMQLKTVIIDLDREIAKTTNKESVLSFPGVNSSLIDDAVNFAEWMDIVCIRAGRFEWKYNNDNYTKKHRTKEMYQEWLDLTSNDILANQKE